MSDAVTPVRLSTVVIDRTAWFAWRSAPATEAALVCTPIDSTSWLGTPDTFPVPVTVMRAAPAAGASLAPLASGEALVCAAPMVNAPMSSPAETTPAATPLDVEESWTAMVLLRCHWGMGYRLDAGTARLVPLRRAGSAGEVTTDRFAGYQAVGPLPSQPRR